MVNMTRIPRKRTRATSRPSQWALHEAKARFSEVVRRARNEGPQRITVHGEEEVVVVSVEDYRRVQGERTGHALVELLHDSPLREVDFDRPRTRGRVRDVTL